MLQGPGENAGVVDIGEGDAVAFKVESHNHPSAVEPFEGAATGVGGILRDIYAMGARPVALLDGLYFGQDDLQFERAVAGIGTYGNCLAADESIVYRNGGKVRQSAIGDLLEGRASALHEASWTASPNRPFQVLSYDPASGEAVWRDVKRVFKRQASSLLKIKTKLGRQLTVTSDHPTIVSEQGRLVTRLASQIQPGDRLPLLCALPSYEGASEGIDLINALDEPSVVCFPAGWQPSPEFREQLRRFISRADARHYWLSRSELPVDIFRKVEPAAGTERRELKLRLAGPRSTSVPAVFPLNSDTARLIGYYLAEGCCSKNGSTFRIIWTFGRNERDEHYVRDIERILDDLGIRHSLETRKSTIAISVSSRLLGRLFREVLECGSRSHEKKIPPQLFDSSERLREEVVKGIFRGDGSASYPQKGSAVRIAHATTSRALHEQLLLILQTYGIVPLRYDRAGATSIQGRRVSSRASYALEFSAHESITRSAHWFGIDEAETILNTNRRTRNSPFARSRARREGNLATVEVVEIEHLNGPTFVYDLEVPGTHNFATSGGIVTHNCVGVPNVAGATFFDSHYAGNCLVNAMCVGILPREQLTSARASGVGSVVMFGATTGRDGIGGASVLASQELGEDDADKRPSVQVGDPFTGKKLIEVSVELIESGLVESLQDCGAAGLASALSEMAASFGLDIHLDRVPLRQDDLEPWEIMISESQERMVAAVSPSLVPAVKEVCARWELPCTEIGTVTDSGVLRCFWDGKLIGDIPARLLTEDAPRYQLELAPRPKQDPPPTPVAPPFHQALLELLASDNIRDRSWVFERYDYVVGSRTVRRPGFDAGVLRLRPSLRGLALSLDGNGRIAWLDPRIGGAHAVLEAARNVACSGGEPLAITNCLNFGNPEKPEMAWELSEAIEGMAQACEALGIPVVSGNVSLYNETDGQPVFPTPVVGCVGLVPDVRALGTAWREGDVVLLAGDARLSIAGSEYQALFDKIGGAPEEFDLQAEAALIRFLWQNYRSFSFAHDVSEGGLAVCLAECVIAGGVGAHLDLPADPVQLFGECGGLAVVACAREQVAGLKAGGVPLREIGTVGGDNLNGLSVSELTRAWQAKDVASKGN